MAHAGKGDEGGARDGVRSRPTSDRADHLIRFAVDDQGRDTQAGQLSASITGGDDGRGLTLYRTEVVPTFIALLTELAKPCRVGGDSPVSP